jgi:hypothetical protein
MYVQEYHNDAIPMRGEDIYSRLYTAISHAIALMDIARLKQESKSKFSKAEKYAKHMQYFREELNTLWDQKSFFEKSTEIKTSRPPVTTKANLRSWHMMDVETPYEEENIYIVWKPSNIEVTTDRWMEDPETGTWCWETVFCNGDKWTHWQAMPCIPPLLNLFKD